MYILLLIKDYILLNFQRS